jgi:NAD-dependent deacetylase
MVAYLDHLSFGEAVPKIEEATILASNADIFVVIGTSLAVYPAAGLINYVADDAKIFIIDKHIPDHLHRKNITYIEDVASIGVSKLLKLI